MRAIILEAPGHLARIELPEPPPPGPGEALVAVRRVGVCGTDLHAFHGRQPFFAYPRILGHELGTEVLAVGPGVTTVHPGDRCAVRPYLECGSCDACRRGSPNCCIRLSVLGAHIDGGMRERIVVPADHLHPSPDLDFDMLALVETLSIGAHAVARARPTQEDRVLVLGAGPIGLGVAGHLRTRGIEPVVADLNGERCAFAEAWAGLRTVRLDIDGDPVAATQDAWAEGQATLVMDATGNAASMAHTFRLAAHGGRIVFVGLFQGDVTFHDPDFHRRELTLMASRNAMAADVEQVIGLLGSGRLRVDTWLTDRCTLDDVPAVLPAWASGSSATIKGIIEVGG
jgi:2-desacetyl-2-hydroxyethyl bacteriochlorophyllide A dehydrogenase